MNIEIHSEVLTNKGRIDSVISSDKYIYIFELKINKKPKEALQQILDKKYFEAYTMYNKPIMLVGMSFIFDQQGFRIEYVSQQCN